MRAAIFVGPSLYNHPVLGDRAFDWRPPAQHGDLYRAARAGCKMIGLIDGQFETVRNVWHKEILWALSNGARVYGSASIGALRAVELSHYGMVGVGAIYRDFRDGRYEDDDEVALMHAQADQDYRPLSEAMIDIRATLTEAANQKILSKWTADRLAAIAKDMFFKDRDWGAIIFRGTRDSLPKAQLLRLRRWLPENRVELKRADAISLVRTMRRDLRLREGLSPNRFKFERTLHWETAKRKLRSAGR